LSYFLPEKVRGADTSGDTAMTDEEFDAAWDVAESLEWIIVN
jgi:hypothetical protein